MEKLNEKAMAEIKAIIGDSANPLQGAPQKGIKLSVESIKADSFDREPTDEEKLSGTELNTSGKVSQKWVRVKFVEGGSLSLVGILRSPDLQWESENVDDRINALAVKGLEGYFGKTAMTSRNGKAYNQLNFKCTKKI